MNLSIRQLALRTERERHKDTVDPRPVETAVLEPRADSMRDMVNMYKRENAAMLWNQADYEEPFVDDETLAMEQELAESPWSDEQLLELGRDMEAAGILPEPPHVPPPGETASEPAEGGSETGDPEGDADTSSTGAA